MNSLQPPERFRRNARALSRFQFILLSSLAPVWAHADERSLPVAVPSNWLLALGLVLAIIFLNSVFMAAGTAFEQLKSMHLKAFEKDDPRASKLQDILDGKSKYVTACTLGRHTMRAWMIMACFVPAPAFACFLSDRFGWPLSWILVFFSGLLISIPVAALNLVAELVSKSYAIVHVNKTAMRLRSVALAMSVVFGIPGQLSAAIANKITQRFGGRASFVVTNPAETEIKELVESAQESGEIEVDERKLIHSVFEFSDTIAREVMTPRVDMDAVPVESAPQEVIQIIGESGHSRIPVYEGTDDQIVGILHAKDLLLADMSKKPTLRKLMREALFVPENKNLHELLEDMRRARTQMAIVQDEFGGTAGIVTIEDIVEELVGEIIDEYDEELPQITRNGIGWAVGGKLNLYDLNEEIGSNIESEEFDTVGGYVFGLFGRQPKKSESVESDGYRFVVDETDGRRIVQLHVIPLESEPEDSVTVI